uniref:Guanine nucleotide-binding protein subunit gamma n=1 Tax=Sinocyclocheilus rhinocerous TaxID=307959 RepID=A0A673HVX1_9TELE
MCPVLCTKLLVSHNLEQSIILSLHYVYHIMHMLVCQISAAAEQLVQYCQEHRRADPLLTGINASSNPFKDKKTCVLL